MQPTIPQPNVEQIPNQPVAPQFNATPLGGMAANMAPGNPNVIPTMPDLAPSAPEVAPLGSPEQLSNPEIQVGPMLGGSDASAPALPIQQPIVVQPATVVSDDSATTTTAPTTAADEDLIEKEWVTKTKQVISATRDDPAAQSQQIAALMRDYVKKRYGREVGKAPDDL